MMVRSTELPIMRRVPPRLVDLTLVRFLLVGLVNTAIGFGTITIAFAAGLPHVAANMLGYAVGILVSYTLNSAFTFVGRRRSLGRFIAVFAVAYSINLVVLEAGIRLFGAHSLLPQLPALVSYTLVFYLLSRFFVFRPAAEALEP